MILLMSGIFKPISQYINILFKILVPSLIEFNFGESERFLYKIGISKTLKLFFEILENISTSKSNPSELIPSDKN